jgi:hypothetical protein
MRFSTPPVLATWLLSYFLPGSENDHIIGDLMEAFQSGRSRTWYWKEVLAAIVIGVSSETVKHPLSALRAISFGWATWLLIYYAVAPKVLEPVFRRIFRPSGYPFSPSMLIWLVVSLLVLAGSGWIVARVNRPHRIATVLLFALSISINQLRNLPWIWSTATNSLNSTRFLPYLIYGLEIQILWPAAILFGGLYFGSPQTNARGTNIAKEHPNQH